MRLHKIKQGKASHRFVNFHSYRSKWLPNFTSLFGYTVVSHLHMSEVMNCMGWSQHPLSKNPVISLEACSAAETTSACLGSGLSCQATSIISFTGYSDLSAAITSHISNKPSSRVITKRPQTLVPVLGGWSGLSAVETSWTKLGTRKSKQMGSPRGNATNRRIIDGTTET